MFAEELNAGYEKLTPEKVIERRIEFQAENREQIRQMNALKRDHIRGYRREVRELVPDDAEFIKLIRHVVRLSGGDRSIKWYRTLALVKKRLTHVLSDHADLVLAWIQQEEKPITHFEIYERRGDGLKPGEILNALIELMNLALVSKVGVVELPDKYKNFEGWIVSTAWSWEAVRPE